MEFFPRNIEIKSDVIYEQLGPSGSGVYAYIQTVRVK